MLVAGAAGGMSAVFGTPIAATLFGVELLAFEFRPRSMVLIGLAAATADGIRMAMATPGLLSPQPIFPVPGHPPLGGIVLLGARGARPRDRARRLADDPSGLPRRGRVQAAHGAPALDVVADDRRRSIIGLGGLIEPRALGVGYNTIHAELLGQLGLSVLALLFVVKLMIWAAGLGSGTSGGILAPVLMLGAAMGGILGHALPGHDPGRVGADRAGRRHGRASPGRRSPPSSSRSS